MMNDQKNNQKKGRKILLGGLGRTLLTWFLFLSLAPMLIVSTISHRNAVNIIHDDIEKALNMIVKMKTEHIRDYFDKMTADLNAQADSQANRQFLEALILAFNESGKMPDDFIKSYEWALLVEEKGADLKSYRQRFGFHDIFLIDAMGNILFSLAEKIDLGTNLISGPYANTRFAEACKKALKTNQFTFSDYDFYAPSGGAVSGFITSVILNEQGDTIGLIAFQFPIDDINTIMHGALDLGKTAEIYLVGPDHTLRSNSTVDSEKAVLHTLVETEQTRLWSSHLEEGRHTEKGGEGHDTLVYEGPHGYPVLGVHNEIFIGEIYFGVIAEIAEKEAFISAVQLRDIVSGLLISTSILVIFLVIIISRSIVLPLKHLADSAQRISRGDTNYVDISMPENEIGDIKKEFMQVRESYQDLTDVCHAISVGDLNHSVTVKSDADMLSSAVNQMAGNLRAVVKQVDAVSRGEYDTEINPRSETDELGIALSRMTKNLRTLSEENSMKDWLKSGQAMMNDSMRGELDTSVLSKTIITFLADYLNAQIGALYVADNNLMLHFAGSYAYKKRKDIPDRFAFGEGLVGEAALKKQSIVLTPVPDDYIRVISGVGEKPPKYIIVCPVLREETVIGIIELGFLNALPETGHQFLDMAAESIAIALYSAGSRARMKSLLEQSKQQAERLQIQQEELNVSNEELEEQTERLQAQQEELRQTNEELEEQTQLLEEQKEKINEKNKDLEQARTLIEQKASDLETTGKYKSEFLANMSHELRTPLNSMLLLSKMLADNKDGDLTDKHLEFARAIYEGGKDLLTLINEVLDLSKVEAGQMEINIEAVRLREFTGSMEKHFNQIAQEKNLNIEMHIAEDMPDSIFTDRQRLAQIIKNLFSNAFKFTQKGEVTLKISRPDADADLSQSCLSPEKTILFSVSDTGTGIPKDKQKIIFEAFRQEDGSTSRRYGGTGLGLSISKELAGLLGGEIKLQSKKGKGSTFMLYLPEKLETDDETDTYVQKISPIEQKPSSVEERQPSITTQCIPDDRQTITPGDKSLLIIEDDPKFAAILYDLSREKGFSVLVAENGETGLHFADYYKPNAIIIDIGLPNMDGMMVMERLKENSQTRHIPVHFMSAHERRSEALKMGAIGFLTKPVSMEKIDQAFGKIEKTITRKVKKLLVVEDDETQRKAIISLIGNSDVVTTTVSSGREAFEQLKTDDFDCMILDLGLPDTSGLELLNMIRDDEAISHLPVIIYTGKELTNEERAKLNRFSEKIIIKDAKSPERLLDETALFLHRIEANLPEDKQRMIRMIHDKETLFQNKKILIVDDDMRNVYAVSNILEEKGIEIIVGRNGKDGLRQLSNHPEVDLVLMDIMMPEMDGYEAMREIRKQKQFSDIPIIALTAKAMKGDKAKCITAGASDYLAKPVDPDKLFSMLRVWLYK